MAVKKTPMRKCAGCDEMKDKKQLVKELLEELIEELKGADEVISSADLGVLL